MFTLHIETGNDALQEDDGTGVHGYALAEILRDVAARVEIGTFEGIVRDDNGNTVGRFGVQS